MIRSRRLAFAAAAVVAGLTVASCGDPAQTTSSDTSASATPPVIKLGTGSGSTNSGAAPAAESDRMMMPYAIFHYVYEGDLPALDGSAPAYQFPAGAQVDTARIAAIAAVLGVEGEVRELAADMGGGWMVGPEDYSGATLSVGSDGMVSWWFSPAPMATPGVECVDAVMVDPAVGEGADGSSGAATPPDTGTGGGEVPADSIPVEVRCEEPQPPAGVPDAATAEQKAKDLFASMGFDSSTYEYETYADEWGANVTAWLLLDGAKAPIALSVGFGAEGAVTWASGVLAEPQPVGDYPLVGAAAGLERLNDESGMWTWYGGPGVMARDTIGGDVAVSSDSGTANETSGGSEAEIAPAPPETLVVPDTQVVPPVEVIDQPVCDPATDCVIEEMPPPEDITITFTDVRLGLTQIWDADGAVWMLPAYVFTSNDGGEWTVIAVDDSFIEMPPMPEPLPVEPMPEPMPVETVVAEPGDDGTDPVEMPDPVDPAAAEILVGLPEAEAAKVAEENGWTLRVVRADGVDFIVTLEYLPARVNVELTAGVVTAIVSIG